MIAILLTTAATSITLTEALADPRTYVYDDRIAPQLVQDDAGLMYPKGQRFSSSRYDGAAVNPNRQKPWLTNAGLDDVPHTAKRLIWIPPGTRIKLRTSKAVATFRDGSRKEVKRTFGTFPDDTLVGVWLYYHGSLFEIRSLKKTDGEWHEDEQIEFFHPPGYKPLSRSCMACHGDITLHRPNWATTTRGLEPGGPIAFTPFVITVPGQLPRIRDDVKHLVEWE